MKKSVSALLLTAAIVAIVLGCSENRSHEVRPRCAKKLRVEDDRYLLKEAFDTAIGTLQFLPSVPLQSRTVAGYEVPTTVTVMEALQKVAADGFIVLHRGDIVFEYYDSCLSMDKPYDLLTDIPEFTDSIIQDILHMENTMYFDERSDEHGSGTWSGRTGSGSGGGFCDSLRGIAGWSYSDMWWISKNIDRTVTVRGALGENIYIAPAAETVIVCLSSFPDMRRPADDIYSLPMYAAICNYLAML